METLPHHEATTLPLDDEEHDTMEITSGGSDRSNGRRQQSSSDYDSTIKRDDQLEDETRQTAHEHHPDHLHLMQGKKQYLTSMLSTDAPFNANADSGEHQAMIPPSSSSEEMDEEVQQSPLLLLVGMLSGIGT
jgi:hypothetical protein